MSKETIGGLPESSDSPQRGILLAKSWLHWLTRLDEVVSVDETSLTASLVVPEDTSHSVRLVISPNLLAVAFDRLVIDGLSVWPDVQDHNEAAWRMLSVELIECLETINKSVSEIVLSVSDSVGFVAAAK